MKVELEIPEQILHTLLDGVEIPPMVQVAYAMHAQPPLHDVEALAYKHVIAASSSIARGERIAVAVGSRGIAGLPEIVAGVIRALRDLGAEPFIVPAMGSHGGATSDGQREALEHLGITSDRVGAPIEAQMETIQVGVTADGTAVRIDRTAYAADGIVLVARVKPHTNFRGPFESGLAKMIAIGLGKQSGASACHAQGFSQMARMIPAIAEVILQRAPIRFALATLENAYNQPFMLELVPAEAILAREPHLLDLARAAMASLPFAAFDVLIVDRIGKDISGDGADPHITGRYPTPDASGGPLVTTQVVLDLTHGTGGNADGLGSADFTTVHALRKVDLGMTYPNALTALVPRTVALPMILPSDRLAIAAGILSCHAVGRKPRIVRLRDTLHLDRFWLSEGLLDSAQTERSLTVLNQLSPMVFDENGDLFDHEAGPTET